MSPPEQGETRGTPELDGLTAARLGREELGEATRQLTEVTRLLAKYPVDERGQLARVPGHGQALVPPVYLDEVTGGRARGRVTFGRYYLGGGGAAHGGAIPLVFDEVMGMLANIGRSPARTAYLSVSYGSITPLETELTVQADLASVDGPSALCAPCSATATPCAPRPRPCSWRCAPASPSRAGRPRGRPRGRRSGTGSGPTQETH